jgi:hypothetical protein
MKLKWQIFAGFTHTIFCLNAKIKIWAKNPTDYECEVRIIRLCKAEVGKISLNK